MLNFNLEDQGFLHIQAILHEVRKDVHDQVQAHLQQYVQRIDVLERCVASLEAKLNVEEHSNEFSLLSADHSLFSAFGGPYSVHTSYDDPSYHALPNRELSPECRGDDGYIMPSSVTTVQFGKQKSVGRSTEEQAMNVIAEGPPEEGSLPESMYNYCMHRLVVSSDPLRDPAFWWLAGLLAIQGSLMVTLSSYNDIAVSEFGASPPADRIHSIGNCLFKNAAVFGVPLMHYMIGFVSIVIVASVIKVDSECSFAAPLPLQDTFLRYPLKLARWWETVYMPGCFALEAASMFAGSPDALTIVTNTLQVTFIMEIDNVLYRNFLTNSAKSAYQLQAKDMPPAPLAAASWSTFALNLSMMTFLFANLVSKLGAEEIYGEQFLRYFESLTNPMRDVMFFVSFLLRHLFEELGKKEWNCKRALKLVARAFVSAAAGKIVYISGMSLVAFRFIVPGYRTWSAEEFSVCAHPDT